MIRWVRYASGPVDRVLSGLVVLVSLGALIWVRVGVFELKKANTRRQYELMQFERLAGEARIRPLKEAEDLAAHFNRELQSQRWHTNLSSLRPEVVLSRTGPRIQFVPTHTRPVGAGPR